MMSKIQPDLPTDRERTLWSVFHRVSPGKWIALYFVARATSFATGCSDPHAAGTLGNKCIQSCDSPHCDEGLSCKESSYDAVSDGVRAPPEIRRRCRTPSVVRYKSPSSAAKRFRSRPTRAAMRAQPLGTPTQVSRSCVAQQTDPCANPITLFDRPLHAFVSHADAYAVLSNSFQRRVDVVIHDQMLPLLPIDIAVRQALEEGDEKLAVSRGHVVAVVHPLERSSSNKPSARSGHPCV